MKRVESSLAQSTFLTAWKTAARPRNPHPALSQHCLRNILVLFTDVATYLINTIAPRQTEPGTDSTLACCAVPVQAEPPRQFGHRPAQQSDVDTLHWRRPFPEACPAHISKTRNSKACFESSPRTGTQPTPCAWRRGQRSCLCPWLAELWWPAGRRLSQHTPMPWRACLPLHPHGTDGATSLAIMTQSHSRFAMAALETVRVKLTLIDDRVHQHARNYLMVKP